MRKKKKIIAKRKRLKEGDFVYVFVSNTHTPQKKKKKNLAAGRKKQKKQQIYIPVFRVALLLIFFGRLGEKKRQRQKEKKATFLPN